VNVMVAHVAAASDRHLVVRGERLFVRAAIETAKVSRGSRAGALETERLLGSGRFPNKASENPIRFDGSFN